jgi:cell division protein FtsB
MTITQLLQVVAIILTIVIFVLTIIIGIIGFFLRRTIGEVDKNSDDIKTIKKDYVTRDELKTFKDDLKDDVKRLSDNIDDIKDNYIKKDDFVRSIADTNSRLERIYNFLLGMNGGKCNG